METGTFYQTQALRRIRVTPDSRFDTLDVLNRAGMMLMGARPWNNWLRETLDIQAVAGQDHVPLPKHWVKVETCVSADPGRYVEVVTRDRFEFIRTRVLVEPNQPWKWRVCLDSLPPETPDVAPSLCYRVWPTPTQNGLPNLRVVGVIGWRDFTATTLANRPPLPRRWHEAYFHAVCCVAVETLDPASGPAPERPLYEAAVDRLWQQEEEMDTDAGELRGGVDEMRDPIDARIVDWSSFTTF